MSEQCAPDQLLRRADWRWLLPQPYFARALCLADGDLLASAHVIDADVLGAVDGPTRLPGTCSYDLVLARGIERETLQSARAALRPGGILYTECKVRGGAALRNLRAQLLASGFTASQLAIRWGAPEIDGAWLPLDSRVARHYLLLRHPIPARHPLRRLCLVARRAAALVYLTAGARRSIAVVARAADGTERRTRQGAAVEPWWVRPASQAALGDGGSTRDWLILMPGRSAESKVVALMVTRGTRLPSIAVKFGRTGPAVDRCVRGFRVLERLWEARVTGLRFAPEPYIQIRRHGGRPFATVERAVNGRWLDTVVRAHTLTRYTEETTNWLIALAGATHGPPRGDAWERLLRPTVARFRACAAGLVDEALLERATALIAGVRALPTVLEHHDFRPWNIYRTRERDLVAFDWDNAECAGVPAFDLLQCHAYLAFTIDRALATGDYARSQVRREAGTLGRTRRACLARYAAAVGLDDAAVRVVRAFVWMGLAADEVEARQAVGSPITCGDVGRSLLALWEVEARAALR